MARTRFLPPLGSLVILLVSAVLAIPPIQVSTIKGTIHEAGVRCICPIESAQVSATPMCPVADIALPPNYFLPDYALTDSNGAFLITVAGCSAWNLRITHNGFNAVDTIFLLDTNSSANLSLYMWRKTVVDPKLGPEWLSIGYPQQWYFVQAPIPAGYYGTLFADTDSKTALSNLYSSTVDLGTFDGKLTKVRGGVEAAGIPKLVVGKADLAQKDRAVIGFVHTSGSVSPQTQFMNTLAVDEVGHVTYTENPCPMCDYLPMPTVDTMINIAKVNALLDLFNTNGYWGFDTLVRPMPSLIGGQSYSLSCDGTDWQVYAASAQEKAIIDGLEAFIKEISGSSAIHVTSASGNSGSVSLARVAGRSIQIVLSGKKPARVGIYDLAGRMVLESRSVASGVSIPTQSLRPGIYLARVTQGSHETASRFAVVP